MISSKSSLTSNIEIRSLFIAGRNATSFFKIIVQIVRKSIL
jgi:hypothetical protein